MDGVGRVRGSYREVLVGTRGANVWVRPAASQSVVVTVLRLAELVQEENDRLEAQNQDDAADEACRVERGVLMWGGGGHHGGICDI